MNHFSFEYPWLLGLIFIFILCARFCKAKGKSIYFPHLGQLLLSTKKENFLPFFLKWLGLSLAIVALASPKLTKEYSNTRKEGRDIVLVIDTSGSMQQGRFDVHNLGRSKFDVTKDVAVDFVKQRKNDRIGLVSFADVAFVASPLTFEKDFLSTIISMQQLGVAGQKTAINDALVQSYSMLENSNSKSKIAILLTDGVDNMSRVGMNDVKTMVAHSDIKLYTIGIGTNRDYNAKYLEALAEAGGGKVFGARNSEMLKEIYTQIDQMEKSKIENKKIEQHRYLFAYPLIFAILSLFFYLYFRAIRSMA